MTRDWLDVTQGEAPLVLSLPHGGNDLPAPVSGGFASPWLARRDADWWIDRLYDFAPALGATVVRTRISRSVIDVNRDPAGVSLYPGQATTGLCPTTTFDGEPLYATGAAADIATRRAIWFDPYHAALRAEIGGLRARHDRIVLYDAHSIRSVIPRLFDGQLPHFNIGTDGGRTCDTALQASIEALCDGSGLSRVSNGRFRGGYITRHHGRPADGVHAVQMELACRGYLREPDRIDEANWPAAYDPVFAAPMRARLHDILTACIAFARTGTPS